MGWFHYGKTTKQLGKGISDYFRHFLVFFRRCGVPQGPQGSPRWKIVCHEKWKLNILLWYNFTLVNTGYQCWTKDYWMIRDMLWPFSSSEGPPKAPWRSPIIPNGWTSMPWEFYMRYFIMGRFHYGKVGRGLSDDLRDVWPIFKLWGAPKGPQGSPMVHNR